MLISLNNQKKYVTVIFAFFAVSFVLYGGLAIRFLADYPPTISNRIILTCTIIRRVLLAGLCGGWMISSLVGGIWITWHFIIQRDTWFIILSCIFFMFTYLFAYFFGLFVAFPYAVYLLFRKKRPGEDFKNQTDNP